MARTLGLHLFHFEEGFAAAEAGQAEIADDEADLVAVCFEKGDRFDAIFRGQDAKSFAFQDRDAELAQHFFVFHEKDGLRNVLPSRGWGRPPPLCSAGDCFTGR